MMRFARILHTTLPAVLTCITAIGTHAQQAVRNPGFEEGPATGVPEGWSAPGAPTTVIEVVTEGAQEGRRAVRLTRSPGSDPSQFGTLLQSVDAAPFRGQRIRLRGWVRTDATAAAMTGLWLRVDRPNRARGFFDNMADRPIRNPEWQAYEITGDVAEDAERIVFGILFQGTGSAWLDDVTLQILGPADPAIIEPPAPLSARGLDNLVAFTRLLGYVRYFHPGDEAASVDWGAFAIAGVRAVERADDPAALAAALTALFQPVAPGVVIAAGRPAPVPVIAGEEVIAWRHTGVGLGDTRSPYRSTRIRAPVAGGVIPDTFPDPAEPLVVDVGGGVTAVVPLAVYADSAGTLPRAPAGADANAVRARGQFTGDDRATRIADVALAWNVFQHFYPYFDVVDTDWNAELPRALESAATDADDAQFAETLQRMVAALHDGHGNVIGGVAGSSRIAPVLWEWIEDQLVVTAVADDAADVRPGDVVLQIDGRPARDTIAEIEVRISAATPQWRRYRAIRTLLVGPESSTLDLEVRSADGATRPVTLHRVHTPQTAPVEPRPEPVAEVRPGIVYVDLTRITNEQFMTALPQLETASGLVFDMRGYPQGIAVTALMHLMSEPGTSAQWHIPVVMRPDRADMRFQRGGEWDLPPREPHLVAPRVFLTDGRAISFAESIMGIVEHYDLGEIIGGTTAGTNGNVNPFTLPGGYNVIWTGMKVLKHDGSQHHGVGIAPTIPAARTIEGVAAGRDELLDLAIEVLGRSSTRGQ